MSLSTNVYNLAVRAATEAKALRTLINGNAGTLAGLSTTDKTSLVNAINEIAAAIATAAGIDDANTATTTTWSSSKTSAEIADALDELVDDGTPNASRVWSSTKTSSAIAALINDGATASGTTWSSTQILAQITAKLDALIGGAPNTADTLAELNTLISGNSDAVTAITNGLAARVRFDAAQSLTAPQQAQARANIGAAVAADVGDTTTNFVTAFEAALV